MSNQQASKFSVVFQEELEGIRIRRKAVLPEIKNNNAPVTTSPAKPDAITTEGESELKKSLKDTSPINPSVIITTKPPPDENQAGLSDAKKSELQECKKLYEEALKENLTGLALSGGGIRSATFSLGMLQALAHFGILRRFDYLSTASGGGYIGSWLSALYHRYRKDGHSAMETNSIVEKILEPNRAEAFNDKGQTSEPEPIRHLRSYSNYLAPKPGFLSVDGWVMVSTYLRNFLLNLSVFVLFFVSLLFLIRFLIEVFAIVHTLPDATSSFWCAVLSPERGFTLWICVALLFAGSLLGNAIATHPRKSQSKQDGVDNAKEEKRRLKSNEKLKDFFEGFSVYGLLVSSILFAIWLTYPDVQKICFADKIQPQLWICGLVFGFVHLSFNIWFTCRALSPLCWILSSWLAGFLGGLVIYFTLYCTIDLVRAYPDFHVPLLITIVPAVMLLMFTLTSCLHLGLLGKWAREDLREWWSRWCAYLMMLAMGWILVMVLTIFMPLLFMPGNDILGVWIKSLLPAGWAGLVLASLKTASSEKTDGKSKQWYLEVIAKAGPYVFVFGFLVIIAYLGHFIGFKFYDEPISYQGVLDAFNNPSPTVLWNIKPWVGLLILFGFCLLNSIILSIGVDINIFSMNAMYANRLTRCYLGGARYKTDSSEETDADKESPFLGRQVAQKTVRSPDFLTGFDPEDDFDISELKHIDKRLGDSKKLQHAGPYHLINTALNLVGGSELAWEERKADSFILSPAFCGSRSTHYWPTTKLGNEPAYAGGIKVGQAVSISGAAASPNMGYHSSPGVTALLTLFNIRLGAWLGNPANQGRSQSSPKVGLLYLLKEMFGKSTAKDDYVYLSDGGHFENLGVYELIRRRCRCIYVVDGGADPERQYEDLGNLIRKVRIDFGIRIDLDIDGLAKKKESHISYTHVVSGRIRYSDVHGELDKNKFGHIKESGQFDDSVDGIIIYVKLGLTGCEPPDLENYRKMNPRFPHEPTSDQFFSESQFESYRALGFHLGYQTLEVLRGHGELPFERDNWKTFKELDAYWHPQPRNLTAAFSNLNDQFLGIQKDLRSNTKFAVLEKECNREMGLLGTALIDPRLDSDLRPMVTQMLTLLENVYYGLEMEDNWDYSLNTGWKKIFMLWFTSPHFRHYSIQVEKQFSVEFRRFIAKRYHGWRTELRSEAENAEKSRGKAEPSKVTKTKTGSKIEDMIEIDLRNLDIPFIPPIEYVNDKSDTSTFWKRKLPANKLEFTLAEETSPFPEMEQRIMENYPTPPEKK